VSYEIGRDDGYDAFNGNFFVKYRSTETRIL
jgi:hypothetical protein